MVRQADLHLWNKFLDGENSALTDIYKRYINELYSYGLKISGNETLVKDCVQEVFIHLIANKKKLIPGPNIHLYLFKSLRSKLLDEIRSGNRRFEILNTKGKYEGDENTPSFETITIQDEEQKHAKLKLQKALNELTDKQREIIYLKYTESLSYDEISIILGIDIASARTLVYRTLKLIKASVNVKGFILFLLSKAYNR